MKKCQLVKTLVCAVLFLGLVSHVQADEKKVKVFILAGQSNMEGHGQLRSLNHLGEHPKYGYLLKKIKNEDGSWAVRDDVTVSWKSRERLSGLLTVGWGFEPHEIGPELMFGTIMGDKYDEPVLLIKIGDVGTVKAFAKGGEAKLVKLEANELESIWKVNIKK
ncbi:hypothetical protein ES703_77538 [subsurface metagenome]